MGGRLEEIGGEEALECGRAEDRVQGERGDGGRRGAEGRGGTKVGLLVVYFLRRHAGVTNITLHVSEEQLSSAYLFGASERPREEEGGGDNFLSSRKYLPRLVKYVPLPSGRRGRA